MFFSDFFLLRDRFSKSFKIAPPLGFHLESGIVFDASSIIAASSLPAGAGLRYRWPFEIQPPVILPSTTAVIDNLRNFPGVWHGWQNAVMLSMMHSYCPIYCAILPLNLNESKRFGQWFPNRQHGFCPQRHKMARIGRGDDGPIQKGALWTCSVLSRYGIPRHSGLFGSGPQSRQL